ncbi:DUF3793 family protein [Peptostreptococcus canis]|uniref:DUF3793 family protein n=1 Tax=Peptostreptococcus canis TaxID=1159213 RepID=A0ABR6TM75_9FIRM|nr:DUF3793 family protein [Peptostreptococcus canis]MBC2576243.1 DUF3793 family protein [Peptostreptococcus canis]MBP1998222.1 hypothetical protein [Peptostreptococcus canis]
MTDAKFESVLANFCSPVLMNEKISNLVSIHKKDIPNIHSLIKYYNYLFKKYDLVMTSVCECSRRVLVFVYKKSLLSEHLRDKNVAEILNKYGYKNIDTLEGYINLLRSRIGHNDFPHEIGIFLGYPIQDVKGFINNRGKNYKYCGYWKVYENIKQAKKIFRQYDRLRNVVTDKLKSGESIENILNQSHSNYNIA